MTASDIDDVAQEVFLRLLRYRPEELVNDPKGYLYKMAANVASEWSMRSSERLPHAANWLDELLDESNPLEDVYRAQRDSIVGSALSRLPARSQEVLRLHLHEGLTQESIARRLKVTPRIVKRDITNAYVQLRASLSMKRPLPSRLPQGEDLES